MTKRTELGIACALSAATLYGIVPNFARGAFVNGVPAVEVTFLRTSLVAVFFAILAITRNDSFRVPRAAVSSLAGQATATLVVSVGYIASVQFIPVGLAVIIFFTFPVLIMLAAPLVEGDSPSARRAAIAVFAFAGLAIAVGPSFESLDLRGILLAAAAAAFCALQFFSGRALSTHMSPPAFGSLVHIIIWPATLLIALYAGGGTLKLFSGGTATGFGYAFSFGVGGLYVMSYLTQMLSLRFAPASIVAPYFNLEPIVATLAAALFLDERLAVNQYAGGGMILAALLASSIVGLRKGGKP